MTPSGEGMNSGDLGFVFQLHLQKFDARTLTILLDVHAHAPSSCVEGQWAPGRWTHGLKLTGGMTGS